MRKAFYSRLVFTAMRQNRQLYRPYLLSSILTVSMFYNSISLAYNPGLNEGFGHRTLTAILSLAWIVTTVFICFFLFYSNSFIAKRRKRELGLYMVLGMNKKHLSRLVLVETVYTYLITIGGGLAIGIVTDKLLLLFLLRIIKAKVSYGFIIAGQAVGIVSGVVAFVFLLILFKTWWSIHRLSPMDLLKSEQFGEKEPKSKKGLTAVGALTLGAGYYIALTTSNPLDLIPLFILATVLVIVGTYCLFVAGSVTLLKWLKNRRSYYYQPKHFISTASMIYRMKQNGAGLASICILSTAVMVMISSSLSLWVGKEDIVNQTVPRQVVLKTNGELTDLQAKYQPVISQLAEADGQKIDHYLSYSSLELLTYFQDNRLIVLDYLQWRQKAKQLGQVFTTTIIQFDDYQAMTGSQLLPLAKDEVYVYSRQLEGMLADNQLSDNLLLGDKRYRIQGELEQTFEHIEKGMGVSNAELVVIVSDASVLRDIQRLAGQIIMQATGEPEKQPVFANYFGFDISGTQEKWLKAATYEALNKEPEGQFSNVKVKKEVRQFLLDVYGGLFFVGLFLGSLFVVAMILIIYYKQLTEGYDDRQRYAIMKKVGIRPKQVKQAIQSQVVTVFFTPLIMTGIHMMVAFPVLKRIMAIMGLTNWRLYGITTLIFFGVFSLFYIAIYSLTAREYYRMVK